MRAAQLISCVSMAGLLASLSALGADVCNPPLAVDSRGQPIATTNYRTTKDVEFAETRNDLNSYYHPYGTITTFVGNRGATETRTGPVWEHCCDCGNDRNAAYRLKIFTKQDPRSEKFDKPILVTQGFDADYGNPGQFEYREFERKLTHVFENDMSRRAFDEAPLLRQLYDEGYDIALLLWKNPTVSIQTNARVTLQALRWLVDHSEEPEGSEPVIIGPSMGGLVTRYALQVAGAEFPRNGIKARLFIAFDSPNRGAEIPMSLQALVTYVRDRGYQQNNTWRNLTNPAARQLLLSSVVNQDTGTVTQQITDYEEKVQCSKDKGIACVHGQFIADLNRLGFRQDIKKIVHSFAGRTEPIYTAAIINGSGAGLDQGLPEGREYLGMSHLTLVPSCVNH